MLSTKRFAIALLCVLSTQVFADEPQKTLINNVDQIQEIVQSAPKPLVSEEMKNMKQEEVSSSSSSSSLSNQDSSIKQEPLAENTNKKAEVVNTAESSVKQDVMQQESPDLEVLEFVLASNIDAREPKEIVEVFGKEVEKGFAFARLNVKKPGEVTFLWYRNDKLVTRFSTQVHASKKWRTYSSVKMRPGQWKVQLLQNDKVLAEKSFNLE